MGGFTSRVELEEVRERVRELGVLEERKGFKGWFWMRKGVLGTLNFSNFFVEPWIMTLYDFGALFFPNFNPAFLKMFQNIYFFLPFFALIDFTNVILLLLISFLSVISIISTPPYLSQYLQSLHPPHNSP